MTTLLLIRHAQSGNNAVSEELRTNDPGLTPLGYRQASKLAVWLAEHPLTRLYCSPFRRSLETTAAIFETTGLVPYVRWDLFEQGGCYDGFPPNPLVASPGLGAGSISRTYPDWRVDERIHEEGWWFGKSYELESQAHARARSVAQWLADEISNAKGVHALVIHADFKRLLLGVMLEAKAHVDLWRDSFNTGVTQLEHTGTGWRLDYWNSIGHLPVELLS